MKTNDIADSGADPRTTEELVGLALDEKDEDAAWDLITALHFRGTREVLTAAERLCAGPTAAERELGATILGQLGVPDRSFPDECFECLARTVRAETDPDVLQAIGVAFGHLDDPRCIELLLPFKAHPDETVRWGVVQGISGHDFPEAIEALIGLSQDEDEEVRDWATFGLGSLIDTDTPEIREALWARLSDSYEDARAEALTGLARRKDPRTVDLLLKELAADDVDIMVIDAAEELGDSRLLPALKRLKKHWPEDRGEEEESLDKAIFSCRLNPEKTR
jgi:HEAT repeat protein